MKKVLIYAYNRLNLGDDLFIKILCERYKKTQFIMLCDRKYSIAFKDIENLKCYSIDTFFERLINLIFRKFKVDNFLKEYHIKRVSAIVTIGGSLFIQNNSWKKGINDLNIRLGINKPNYLIGCNFGPFYDEEYLKQYRNLFLKYKDICFRDSYSYELFKDINTVRMAPDIVFQLNGKLEEKINNSVVISVIKPSIRKELIGLDSDYYNKIKELIIEFINRGLDVTLMSFCKDEGDEEAIDEIYSLIDDKYIKMLTKYYYAGNIEEALKIINNAKFIIATRFHSMILGYACNKPTFPIVYSKKMSNVIFDIDTNIKYVDLQNINKIKASEVYEYMVSQKVDISKQRIESEKHFEILDKYLND